MDLLNDWQQRLPLCSRPFLAMARQQDCSEAELIAELERACQSGQVSRLGGAFAAGVGGAALLCALAVPEDRLEAVAARVNAVPGVNHNYEREHHYNLWFVITAPEPALIASRLQTLEQDCGLSALRLPMRRAYRINLGFDLRQGSAPALAPPAIAATRRRPEARAVVADADRPLAALLEEGLPLRPQPYAAWAQTLGWTEDRVLQTLQTWLDQGVLRRFGVIVRHHELGIAANAMCVFDLPDDQVDAYGERLAAQAGVSLCYRRERAPGWSYNLFCMIHGRERAQVQQALAEARAAAGLEAVPQAQLFSRRRFKQCGGRYFSEAPTGAHGTQEFIHA